MGTSQGVFPITKKITKTLLEQNKQLTKLAQQALGKLVRTDNNRPTANHLLYNSQSRLVRKALFWQHLLLCLLILYFFFIAAMSLTCLNVGKATVHSQIISRVTHFISALKMFVCWLSTLDVIQ